MRLFSLVGDHGSTPRFWRARFLDRTAARAAPQRIMNWEPERLLIAHGKNATTRASEIIREALSWI
jgi:hypothetical protein